MVLDTEFVDYLARRIADWPLPPGDTLPPLAWRLVDPGSRQAIEPERTTSWLAYRTACLLVCGRKIPPFADDLEWGRLVARGVRRIRRGKVPIGRFCLAYGACLDVIRV